jgi:hypothetical protein
LIKEKSSMSLAAFARQFTKYQANEATK